MNHKVNQLFVDKFTEAENLFKENRFNESLEKYQTLLKDHPDHIYVLNNMGLVYEKTGDLNKSLELYKKCNELMPNQAVLIHNLANVYTQLERWADALPLLKSIIDSDLGNEKNAEKYALCLFNTSSKEEVEHFISSVISKYPDNKLLNRLLGRALLYLNAHIDGLKYLQKGSGVVELDNDGVKYLN